jgi:hypothetical protein
VLTFAVVMVVQVEEAEEEVLRKCFKYGVWAWSAYDRTAQQVRKAPYRLSPMYMLISSSKPGIVICPHRASGNQARKPTGQLEMHCHKD